MIFYLIFPLFLIVGLEARKNLTCYQLFIADPNPPFPIVPPPRKKPSFPFAPPLQKRASVDARQRWTKFCYNCNTDADCEGDAPCKIHPHMWDAPRKCCLYECELIRDDPGLTSSEEMEQCIHDLGYWWCRVKTSWCMNPWTPTWAPPPTEATVRTRPTVPLPPAPVNTEQVMKELMNCVKYKLRRSKTTSNCNQESEKLYKECAMIVKGRFALPLPDG